MKSGRTAAVLLAALIAAPPMAGFGQEPEKEKTWTIGAEFDFNSKYVWRSLAFSEGAVWQPSVYVGISGLTFQVWSNYVLDKEPNFHQFNEVDYRLSFKSGIGDFTIESAFTIYSYPNKDKTMNPTTGEAEIQIGYAVGDFTLETAHFFDFWQNKGGYVGEVGLEFEKEAGAGLTLAAAVRLVYANAKFNSYYIRPDTSGAIDALVLEAGLTYAFSSGFYIQPHLEWNSVFDSKVRAAIKASDWVSLRKPDLFNFGVAVGFSY